METLTVGSLFSGIGGLDLGLERAGMRVIWQSEIDPYACRVLAKHWPDVPNLGNIKEIDWSKCEQPDVICGGYPCQPFSTAGKRRGEEDPRHLWPWIRDAISELRPRYAILENVRGHLSMGGLSVIGELASIGYDAEWRVVSAASVGANHRRDRVIIVAYPNRNNESDGSKHEFGLVAYPNDARPHRAEINATETGEPPQRGIGGCGEDVAYPNKSRCQAFVFQRKTDRATNVGKCNSSNESIHKWWETEPDVGRVADGIPHRVDRLRGLGNAVVPQVAEVIGRLVVEHAQWKQQPSRST